MRRALFLLPLLLLAACDQDMIDQPKYEEYEPAMLFPDGTVQQPPVEGTVARGALARRAQLATPPALTPALLARGQERFEIYCAPCHGLTGHGDGMIVRRGFPPPPSYHSDRLRAMPLGYVVQVITHGIGDMFSYAARVPPADRWAIEAYIRALQVSQRSAVGDLPPALSAAVRANADEGAP